jgi:hypothetical protein
MTVSFSNESTKFSNGLPSCSAILKSVLLKRGAQLKHRDNFTFTFTRRYCSSPVVENSGDRGHQ